MTVIKLARRGRAAFRRTDARIDASLSLMLWVQIVTMFVVIPLGWRTGAGRLLLDLCHLAFAAICICVLARRRAVQAALLIAMALLVCGPRLPVAARVGPTALFVTMSLVAFAFNALVTALVARHVFGGDRVTGHRLRGAILVYLNVAALFSIAYGILDMLVPGAIASVSGHLVARDFAAHTGALTYFSLTTITTTGFGDLVPIDPLARALANLESVFGHLFPATLLARLVALHVAGTAAAPTRARIEGEPRTEDPALDRAALARLLDGPPPVEERTVRVAEPA